MLDIMTWNVRYFGQAMGGLWSSEANLQRAAGAVAGLPRPPQVVLLQEVEASSLRAGFRPTGQAERFCVALNGALARAGYGWRYRALYFPAHRYAPTDASPALYTTGLAAMIAEEVEVVRHGKAEVTHLRHPRMAGLKQRRIVAALRLRVPDTGREVDVFNVHLSLPAFLEDNPLTLTARMGSGSNQLREVEALLAAIAAHREAEGGSAGVGMVVGGDLNSLPGSPVLRRLHGVGLAELCPVGAEVGTARFMHLRMHLDHLLASADLLERAQPGPFWAVEDAKGPFYGLSDHVPRIASVQP